MALIPDDCPPFLRVFIALRHNDSNLFRPGWTELKDAIVNLHGDSAGVSYNHSLARKQVRTVILVVVKDIIDKRSNGLIISEDCLHLTEFFLALRHHFGIGIVRHDFVLCINHAQSFFIKVQFDDSTLIVNRAGSTILDRLRHVVDINIVTKDLTGASVLHRNGRTSESYVCSIREAVADDTGCADLDFTCLGINPFLQSVLPAMSLVSHNDNVPALGERLVGFLELLHRGKDDAVCLSAVKQGFQMLPALGVHRLLTQKVLTLGELSEKLIVKVVAIG